MKLSNRPCPKGENNEFETFKNQGFLFKWIFAIFFLLSSSSAYAVFAKDLSLTLKATPNPVAVNSNLTYSLGVKNSGTQAVTGVVLRNKLPATTVYVSASPNCAFANATDQANKIITCKANSLLANASIAWSVTVKSPAVVGIIVSSANVRFTGTDGNPADNVASVSTTVKLANRAPVASPISLKTTSIIPYVEQKLIGTDADKDTLSFVLDAPQAGVGYSLAYLNPKRGILYVTITPKFQGTISLPYRVSDGKLFSAPATVKIVVQAASVLNRGLGGKTIDPALYASYQQARLSSDLFGAPGNPPIEPASVDLSPNFPAAGNQGRQNSCVAWASAYALKSYQEAVEMKWPFNTKSHLFSPAYVYNQINHGQDQGSQITDALDLIIKQGAATFATTPYSDTDYLTQPSVAAKTEAAHFKGVSLSAVNGTQAIKAALVNRKPVVIGMEVYDQFYKLIGANSVYNSKAGTSTGPHGRHAITIVGYDNNRFGGAFKVLNSWGNTWGDNGYFWMTYSFAEQVVFQAWVLEDGKNTNVPVVPDDNVVPPVTGKLPNLQVKSWNATFDPILGGNGKMEWTVINSGTANSPAGATVAIMLSKDNIINASDTYVVYDQIPFALTIGGTAYRSFLEGNYIPFKIPGTIAPGDYYLALWVDDLNKIKESKEDDNVSLASAKNTFSDTRPDLAVQSWFALPYDNLGNYSLTYDFNNAGTKPALKNFAVSLVLSTTQNLGDGHQRWLFNEFYPFDLPAGFRAYRDIFNPGYFNLYRDTQGISIPQGNYYMAFWLDYQNKVIESDEINNTSFSWGLISTFLSGAQAPKSITRGDNAAITDDLIPLDRAIFNGTKLPESNVQMRRVRISQAANGARTMQFLDTPPNAPTKELSTEKVFAKSVGSENNVIFPTTESNPMP